MLLNVYVLTYNRCKMLEETISSILNQSFKEFDLFILDNCSDDQTAQIVSQYKDKRIHYIRHEKNIGEFGNSTYALTHCNTKYMVMFHDDDLMLPGLLEEELEFLESHEDVAAVSSNAIIFGHTPLDGRTFRTQKTGVTRYTKETLFGHYLETGETLVYPSIMYRTTFIKTNDICFSQNAGPCSDFVFYMDIALAGGILCEINKPLLRYRIHEGQDSKKNNYNMYLTLYNFFNKEKRYGNLFVENKKGREEAYQRIAKLTITGWMNGTIDNEETATLLKDYQNSLLIHNDKWIKRFLFFEKFPKTVKCLYKLYRKIKY